MKKALLATAMILSTSVAFADNKPQPVPPTHKETLEYPTCGYIASLMRDKGFKQTSPLRPSARISSIGTDWINHKTGQWVECENGSRDTITLSLRSIDDLLKWESKITEWKKDRKEKKLKKLDNFLNSKRD